MQPFVCVSVSVSVARATVNVRVCDCRKNKEFYPANFGLQSALCLRSCWHSPPRPRLVLRLRCLGDTYTHVHVRKCSEVERRENKGE